MDITFLLFYCFSWNIIWFKIFQMLNIADFRSNVPYYDWEIDNTLHLPGMTLCNAGIIALVYKYTDPSGNSWAVKIKRKDIESRLIKGAKSIKWWLSFIYLQHLIDISDLLLQCDFNSEMKSMQLLQQHCQYITYVRIPKLNDTLSHSHRIVMEWLDGKNINEIDTKDRVHYAKNIIKFGTSCVLTHGLTHSDLHSGNLLFLPNHQIGILDLGLTHQLQPNFQKHLLTLLSEIYQNTNTNYKLLLSLPIFTQHNILTYLPNQTQQQLITLTQELITNNKQHIHTQSIIQYIKHILSLTKQYNIPLNTHFLKTQTSILMAYQTTMSLCNHQYSQLIEETLNELLCTHLLT